MDKKDLPTRRGNYGPAITVPNGKTVCVYLGERERAMMKIYIRDRPDVATDRSAFVRAAIQAYCADLSQDEIEAEIATERKADTDG